MKNTGRFSRFLNGKGFYVALGICMVAIGISGWTAMKGIEKINTDNQTSDKGTASSITSSGLEVTQIQSDVPDTKEDNSSSQNIVSTKEPTKEAAAPVAKYFVYPVNGEILKGFNNTELQYSLTYNDMRLHTGIDIRANSGTSVKSAGDGVVISVENDALWGYTIKINHGNGVTGVYCGLTKAVAVKKGDTVKAGTNLGPLGTIPCESVDAPHLHLEFIKDKEPVSPISLLKNE